MKTAYFSLGCPNKEKTENGKDGNPNFLFKPNRNLGFCRIANQEEEMVKKWGRDIGICKLGFHRHQRFFDPGGTAMKSFGKKTRNHIQSWKQLEAL